MMRLSTMWKVDRTVDGDDRSPIADRILEGWTYDAGTARFFRSSANFVYTLRKGGAAHFLRFADATERTKEAIEAEVAVVDRLASAGVDVARPVPSRDGDLVTTTETEQGIFHAVVFVGLEGEHAEIEDLDGAGFWRWGAALGGLHAELKGRSGAALAARPTWRNQLALAEAVIPEDRPIVRDELAALASVLDGLPVERETFGLIHGDFELDNLCWRDDGLGIVDFDDCCRHWYAADIAFALRDRFAGGFDGSDDAFHRFIDGYASRHPVESKALAQVPTFLRLANVIAYARVIRCLDLPTDERYPEWLEDLAGKMKARMEDYEASLVRQRG